LTPEGADKAAKTLNSSYRKTFNQIPKEERCSDCDSIANGAPRRAYRSATMQAPTTASRSTPDGTVNLCG
jgi:hypothetical protein